VNILVVGAFIQLREILATHKDLEARMEKLEAEQRTHASVINVLADEIDQLKAVPEHPKRRIGFQIDE